MKLYWCPSCERFVDHIESTVTLENVVLRVTAKDIEQNELSVDSEQIWIVRLQDLQNIICMECNKAVELKTIESCPHDWSLFETLGYRYCNLCGNLEQGRFVFD